MPGADGVPGSGVTTGSPGEEQRLVFHLHTGTSFGKGIRVLPEDSRDVQELKRALESCPEEDDVSELHDSALIEVWGTPPESLGGTPPESLETTPSLSVEQVTLAQKVLEGTPFVEQVTLAQKVLEGTPSVEQVTLAQKVLEGTPSVEQVTLAQKVLEGTPFVEQVTLAQKVPETTPSLSVEQVTLAQKVLEGTPFVEQVTLAQKVPETTPSLSVEQVTLAQKVPETTPSLSVEQVTLAQKVPETTPSLSVEQVTLAQKVPETTPSLSVEQVTLAQKVPETTPSLSVEQVTLAQKVPETTPSLSVQQVKQKVPEMTPSLSVEQVTLAQKVLEGTPFVEQVTLAQKVLEGTPFVEQVTLAHVKQTDPPRRFHVRAQLKTFQPQRLYQSLKLYCPKCQTMREVPDDDSVGGVFSAALKDYVPVQARWRLAWKFGLIAGQLDLPTDAQGLDRSLTVYVSRQLKRRGGHKDLVFLMGALLEETCQLALGSPNIVPLRQSQKSMTLLDLDSAPFLFRGPMRYYGCERCSDVSLKGLLTFAEAVLDEKVIAEVLGVQPLQYRLAMILELQDGTDTLEALLLGGDADSFFHVSAEEVAANQEAQDRIQETMDKLCPPGSSMAERPWLDLCLRAYKVDQNGQNQVCYQICQTGGPPSSDPSSS